MKSYYTWSRDPRDGEPFVLREQQQWFRWLSDNVERIFVGRWDAPEVPSIASWGAVRISTVFLGIALHSGREPPRHPQLFETRILGGPSDGYRVASDSYAQAAAVHAETVELYQRHGPRAFLPDRWPDQEFRHQAEVVHRIAVPRDLSTPLRVVQISLDDLFSEGPDAITAETFKKPEEEKAPAHTPGRRKLKTPTVGSYRHRNPVKSTSPIQGRERYMEQVPQGYMLVNEVDERVQQGDMLWDETDEEWLPAQRSELGEYVTTFYAVCRVDPTQHCNKRVRRSRNRG